MAENWRKTALLCAPFALLFVAVLLLLVRDWDRDALRLAVTIARQRDEAERGLSQSDAIAAAYPPAQPEGD